MTTIQERFFFVGEQWCVIHIPKKPNGFAIFIIGDVNHFVQGTTSSWNQHPDRRAFIEGLKNRGYTVYYSNLFGRNWGSDKACELAIRLYDDIMKREILNKKIHIIAEGMGALISVKILPKFKQKVRSLLLINPCLSLAAYYKTEQKSKLFYKRFIKELQAAYGKDGTELEALIQSMDIASIEKIETPTRILHCLNKTPYMLSDHVKPYEKKCQEYQLPLEVSIHLDKPFVQLVKPTVKFIKKHEKDL